MAAPAQESVRQDSSSPSQGKTRSVRPLLQVLGSSIWSIGSLFLGAGRVDWIRGWICVALWIVGLTTVGLISHHYNAGLMQARAKWNRKDTKRFDKIFFAVYVPLLLVQPAVAGLDVVRFRWSSLPFGFVYLGALLFALAMVLIGWVLSINPYAETSVRIQNDRGQSVVTSGPYKIVRHPMYVGAVLMYLGMPLVWGSVWALLLGAVISLLFIPRTALEDRTLRRELSGYEDFTTRTRYRLLPGVW